MECAILTFMKFTQQFSETDHRYIFRQFLRRRYPWAVHFLLTAGIILLAFVMGARWGYNTPRTGVIAAIAVGYVLLTLYIIPRYMEFCVMRNIRKSVSYGRKIEYAADRYGLSYAAGGREYELLWSKLTLLELIDRGAFLKFGKNAGVCVFKASFADGAAFNEFIKLAEENSGCSAVRRRF